MRSYHTWSSPTTIRSVPPLAWPPTRFTWAGSRASLSLFSHRSGVADHQILARHHLAYYCDLASERQQCANDVVREMHASTVSRVERRNSALSHALRQIPNFFVGNWVWLYNRASTIHQGAKAGMDVNVLKTKFALNWTGPYKILAVDPCPSSDTLDGFPLEDKLLYLDLPTDMPARMRTVASLSSAASPAPTLTAAATCLSTFRMG